MIDGIDYNVEPEPIPQPQETPYDRFMAKLERRDAYRKTPEYIAKYEARVNRELDGGDPELSDPEDENRLLGTDDNNTNYESTT